MKKKTDLNKARIKKLNWRAKKARLKKRIKNAQVSGSWKDILRLRDDLSRKGGVRSCSKAQRLRRVCRHLRLAIKAPSHIDFYNSHNFEVVTNFLNRIRSCVVEGGRVFIDFSNTEYISAAAMLSFLAEVDIATSKSSLGRRAISFNHPKNDKIESILKQVGFYGLLKKEERDTGEYDDVTFWKYASGVCSEPVLAREIFSEIKQAIQIAGSKKLYRGFVEAMSNSVEHAYAAEASNDCASSTAKWWVFAGIREGQLVFVICDKGVGIPNTLPATQKGNIDKIFSMLGIVGRKDSAYIKAASNLNRTSTAMPNRGKGLTDIKSVINSHESARVSIFSNRGRYIYKGNAGLVREIAFDYKHSVNGTIIEWVLPLEQ